ncbi:MAG: hypothetical protein WCC30_13775 [Candidatus Dormiibacterota bacterium]
MAGSGRPADLTPARSVVDGVPVFSLAMPGPLRAMLVFRVGAVDETLPTHGLTHLVEHLAMFPLMQGIDAANRINARVEPLRTRFIATGTPEEVTAFLGNVTSTLSRLPVDRLESEKKVLRTEAANQRAGSLKAAWSWRYGARGPGLVDFEEFGLRWLGPDHLADWAHTWFTAGNAVLWLTGAVPDNLRLNVPVGPRRPLPDLVPLRYTTPAIYQQGDRWVLLSMLGARSNAILIGTRVLDARLRERLRNERSLSYDVHANYQRLARDTAEVTAFADSLAPSAREAAEAMADVVRGMADGGPRKEELSAVLAERRRVQEHPDAGLGRLDQVAVEELEGLESTSIAELDAEAEALTPADISEAFRSAYQTSYLGIPKDVPMAVPGFTPIPASSGEPIKGIQVVPMPGAGHSDVIDYSVEGISLTQPNRTTIGLRWSDVAVALWWSDGRRSLLGNDGSGIQIVPAKWRNVQPLLDAVRANVPPDRWVPMDEAGAMPRLAGPICSICQASPAIEVTFRNPRSLLMIWFGRVHGVLCRDCGIAKFREIQRLVLLRGWWSIPGIVVAPVALLYNTTIYFRFKKLPVPIRTSGINPLPKGRTIWLYPGMLIPAALVLAAAWVLWPR